MTACEDCGAELVERNVLALPNPEPEARATFVRTALVRTCPNCDAPGGFVGVDVVVMSVFGWWEEEHLSPCLTVSEVLKRYRATYPVTNGMVLLPSIDGPDGRRSIALLQLLVDLVDDSGSLVIYLATAA